MMNCLLPTSGGENSTELNPAVVDMALRLLATLRPLLRWETKNPLCHILALIFQAYCQLCAKLHQDPPETNVLTDIHSWWTKSVCKIDKIERGRDFNGNP